MAPGCLSKSLSNHTTKLTTKIIVPITSAKDIKFKTPLNMPATACPPGIDAKIVIATTTIMASTITLNAVSNASSTKFESAFILNTY
ncbi:MAG: hypothetical protein QW530_00295 [Candidatus Micrarchaeaceae archaeon]